MNQPVVLAIETSQRSGGVAVRDRRGDVRVEPLTAERRHDDDLLPAIDRLFSLAGLKPADLGDGGAVGLSIGPGGFTGLRIAVSAAKMLAETVGAKLVAVPSVLVAAESMGLDRAGPARLLVALACKGDRFWGSKLERQIDGAWRIAGRPGPCEASEADLQGVSAVVGDRFLPDVLRERCRAAGLPVLEPRFEAEACLAVACRRLEEGLTADPLELSPLYSRPPEAVSLWEKRKREREGRVDS